MLEAGLWMACGLVRGEVELGGGDVGVALGVGAAIRWEPVDDALQQLPRLGRRALKLLDSWWAEAGQQSEAVPVEGVAEGRGRGEPVRTDWRWAASTSDSRSATVAACSSSRRMCCTPCRLSSAGLRTRAVGVGDLVPARLPPPGQAPPSAVEGPLSTGNGRRRWAPGRQAPPPSPPSLNPPPLPPGCPPHPAQPPVHIRGPGHQRGPGRCCLWPSCAKRLVLARVFESIV